MKDDRTREITQEMIEDAKILNKTQFRIKYHCGDRIFYKIKKGE